MHEVTGEGRDFITWQMPLCVAFQYQHRNWTRHGIRCRRAIGETELDQAAREIQSLLADAEEATIEGL